MSDRPESVIIFVKAIGDAPRLKQQKFRISASERFGKILDVLKQRTRSEQLFLYLHSSFCPSLDEKVLTLYQAYGRDGQLAVQYCTAPAWG